MKKYNVSLETLEVLKTCKMTDRVLYIPQQLERSVYDEVNKVLLALGAKWDKKSNGHVFEYDMSKEFQNVIETGTYNNWKKDTDYFTTPKVVLEFIGNFIPFGHEDEIDILEPSAGNGGILDYLAEEFPKARLSAVEINPFHIPVLKDKPYEADVFHDDFMKYKPDRLFDLIVMNPPFKNDTEHIIRAYAMLRPGGTLISVASKGVTFRKNGVYKVWGEFVDDKYCSIIDLPPNSFNESGTNVNAVLISITKFDVAHQFYRYCPQTENSYATVEIENVPDELYGVTTVVVSVLDFLNGKTSFPCASGSDISLTNEMQAEVHSLLDEHKTKICIGRPINGITINPLEFVLDDDGEVKTFENEDVARDFLKRNGFTDEDIDYLTFQEI